MTNPRKQICSISQAYLYTLLQTENGWLTKRQTLFWEKFHNYKNLPLVRFLQTFHWLATH